MVRPLRVVGEAADRAPEARDDADHLGADMDRVREAGRILRLGVDRRAPPHNLLGRGVGGELAEVADDRLHPRSDSVERCPDDVVDPLDALVVAVHVQDLVEQRLLARETRDRRENGRDRAGRAPALRLRFLVAAGVGLEVKEPPVDLGIGAPPLERLDHVPERLVVEHATVDEERRGRVCTRELVDPEQAPQRLRQIDGFLLHCVLEGAEADRRECARKAHRRARGERERAVVRGVKRILTVAELEGEHVPVRRVADCGRVGDEEVAAVAVEVGHGDKELDRVALRHQRLDLCWLGPALVHVLECAVHPFGDLVALEHRLLDRAHEQERRLEPHRHPLRAAQQHLDVAALEPEVPERVLRAVVRDRLREVDPVDPPCRGPGDDVDDDACAHTIRVALGELIEQLDVGLLGRGASLRPAIDERRGLDQSLELLGRAVHVDRKRGTTVKDDAEPELAHLGTLRWQCGRS